MPYTPQLVVAGVLGPTTGGMGVVGTGLRGMSDPSRYWLWSMVVCLPPASGVGIGFSSTLTSVNIIGNSIAIGIEPSFESGDIVNATYDVSLIGIQSHILVSVDTVGQILQVYVNDVPLSITSGGWTGSGMVSYGAYGSQWELGANYGNPGVADWWMANPTSFFDLTVVSNRRKFINADLSLVDLGTNGAGPLGTPPPIFLTVRPGDSVADHFANNNGSDGSVSGSGHGPWSILSEPLAIEPGGICTVPYTPPPPTPVSLAMDSLLVTGPATLPTDNRIFLDWSDDRGHSFHIPVGQNIGQPGAYLTALQWQRLGYGRDRVFRLTWSAPVATALQGAWIQILGTGKT